MKKRIVISEPMVPRVDERRCTGCGDCVRVCPTACLAMDGRLPWLVRPGECIACSLCVLVCPAEALSMQTRDV